MNELKSQEIKKVIKYLLKKNNVTYDEVASHLECSLPTVNRILGPEEIGLSRILQLCELLNITFTDLGAMTKDPLQTEEVFSDSQEHFLSKHNHFLAYYLKLMSGETSEKIAKDFNLTKLSTDKYLLQLEKYELIKVTNKNKIHTAFKNMPKLGSGPLGSIYFDKIINGCAQFFIKNIHKNLESKSPTNNKIVNFNLTSMKMTELSYRNFSNEVEILFNRYSEISDMEEKIKNIKDLKTVVLSFGHTIVENDEPSLKLVENMFGNIRNI